MTATHPLIEQYDQILPTVDQVFTGLDTAMRQGLQLLSVLPIPASAVQPFVDRWNDQVVQLDRSRGDIATTGTQVQAYCLRLLTLREAGQEWQTAIATEKGYPFAQALTREELEGDTAFSWQSIAVEGYWSHIEGNAETAEALAEFSDSIGASLIALADAIDKQATDLGWAIFGFIMSLLGLAGGAIALGLAIGALSGALAGAPVGGVGAIPGAVIGGLVGAIIGLVVAIGGLVISINAWIAALKVVSDAATAELATLESDLRGAELHPWPAPGGTGAGADYRED